MFVKSWEHKQLTCIIRLVGNHYCGYVVIPDKYWDYISDLANNDYFDVNGGISYIGTSIEPCNYNVCIGFDMCHAWDGYYDEDYKWINTRTEQDCYLETEFLAEQIAQLITN